MRHIEINLNVTIHKVKLQVKFPCSLVAFLRAEKLQASFGSEVPIKQGQAHLEATANMRLVVLADSKNNLSTDKKISVNIFLSTPSGRIPAGAAIITFNLLKKAANKETINIQKCPDKSAFIQTTISYEVLNQITSSSMKQISNRQTSPTNQLFTLRENSLAQQLRAKKSQPKQIGGSMNSPKESQRSEAFKSNLQDLQTSKVGSQSSNGMIQSNILKKSNQKAEKSGYLSPKHFNSTSTDYTIKSKLFELERDLKNTQKRYEQCSAQLKEALLKKDALQRQLKDSQGQAKLYKDKYQNIEVLNENTQKRNEYKEHSYKQQIKQLTDKLAMVQNEKQLMIFQKNDVVTEFEQREKTLRLGFKEKQKQFAEQRNKANKKLQQMGKDMLKLQSKITEAQLKLAEANQQADKLVNKNEVLAQACRQHQLEVLSLREALLVEKSKREEVQEVLGSNTLLEEQKRKLKKKMVEQQQQLTKKLNTNIQLSSNYERLQKKIQQSQSLIKEKNHLIKNLQSNNQTIHQQYQSLKKQYQSTSLQLQQALSMKQNENKRADALHDQIRQIQKKTNQEIRALRKDQQQKQIRIHSLVRQNECYCEEIEDFHLRVQNLQGQIEALTKKINEATKTNNDLIHIKTELDGQIILLQTNLSEQKVSKQHLQRGFRQQISLRESKIRQLQENIKDLGKKLTNRQQEDITRIRNIGQKNASLEDQVKRMSEQIQLLKNNIDQLSQAKMANQANIQQLQYTIKLRSNEIIFLKESVQRNFSQGNQTLSQNRQFQQNLLKCKSENSELKLQIQGLIEALDEAKSASWLSKQQLDRYAQNNKIRLRQFLSAISKDEEASFVAIFQQPQIQSLMRSSFTRIKEIRAKNRLEISSLKQALALQKERLSETLIQLGLVKGERDLVREQLSEMTLKELQANKMFQNSSRQVRVKLQGLNKQIDELQHENASLKQFTSKLSQEFKNLQQDIASSNEQNCTLKAKLNELQDTLRIKEEQFSIKQSRQSTQFQEESSTFKSRISELQQRAQSQATKIKDLTSQLNELTKSYKQLQKSTLEQNKKSTAEIQKLNVQLSKQAKQIEAKNNVNLKSSQAESELRGKLDQANKDLASLKQINLNMRKANQKTALKQQEQETAITGLKNTLSQLNKKLKDFEKAIKQKTAQFVQSRQDSYQLEKENQKLKQQLQISAALVKVKEDGQSKSQLLIKSLEEQKRNLQAKLKGLQIGWEQASKKKQKQLALLQQSKQKVTKQLEEMKIRLENKDKELKMNHQNSKQLTSQIDQLQSTINSLSTKIESLTQNIQEQQKKSSYLKPVRENLQLLRGHMNQYARVADQFESNKNKLIKVTTTRVELGNINDKLKDVSLAYNKLKLLILGWSLSVQAKQEVGEQMKKVQAVLDRALRGDK